jgi:hypothetical protein
MTSAISIGFAGALIARMESRYEPGDANRWAVNSAINMHGGMWLVPELLDLASKIDKKTASIVHTMRNPRNRYSRITERQRNAVTHSVLTRYSTARAAFAAAFGVSEDELMAAGRAYSE